MPHGQDGHEQKMRVTRYKKFAAVAAGVVADEAAAVQSETRIE